MSLDCLRAYSVLCINSYPLHEILFQALIDLFGPLLFIQSIPSIPPIPSSYNPATWMLEISTPAAEERIGEDFAVIHRNSNQYR